MLSPMAAVPSAWPRTRKRRTIRPPKSCAPKRVSDATYRRAVAKFGEQGVIDLLGVVGYYNFLAIVMNATRTALPDNVTEPLKRYPE
jgi:hypothetical protein